MIGNIQAKRQALQREIDRYRKDSKDPSNQDNKSYLDFTQGLLLGLGRAECILIELEEEEEANREEARNHC